MRSVEQVAGAIGEADADVAAEFAAAPGAGGVGVGVGTSELPAPVDAGEPAVGSAASPDQAGPAVAHAEPADPWAAILEAGAAMLQGLASARSAGGGAPGAAPFTIERDPATGQASVRLPLPDAAVLQRLAKAFEPWLR
jgi:hypothetical protein